MNKKYQTFSEFYPYYLSEHSNHICRRLHFIGSIFALAAVVYVITTRSWWVLLACPIFGYGFGWVGHAFFEKNTPTTSTYPLYSFCAYWVMVGDIFVRRLKF